MLVHCAFFQDNGAMLAAHDDANEHVLTIWDWQKTKKVAESKVRLLSPSPRLLSFYCSLVLSDKLDNMAN